MQKRFIKNIIFLLFLNLLVKPFWILGIDREVQNVVGNSGDGGYGVFISIFSFSYLFYILLDLGITNYNNRNIAQNNQLLSKQFAGITQVKLFLSFVYIAVLFGVGLIIGYRGFKLRLLGWCAVNQILLSFILYLRSNISGLLMFKTDSVLSVLDRLLAIAICSVLLWSGLFPRSEFNILWYVKAQTVSYICTLALALFIVLKHTSNLTFKINIPFFIAILKQSLPFALLVLLMSFYSRLEPVLLERMLVNDHGYQAGIYAQAYRLFDAGNNISNLFAVILLPMFAAIIKKNDHVDLSDLVKTSFSIIVALVGIIAVLGIAYSDETMRLLYRIQESETPELYQSRIEQASLVFKILMGSFFSISTTYVFGTLLTANGSLKHLNIIAASGVVLNIILNLIFIPIFKSVGAACTSLCVQSVTAFLQYLLAKRILKLDIGNRYWLHLLLFLTLIIASTFLVKTANLHWTVSFFISLIINISLIFVTKLLNFKDIVRLFLPAAKK